MRKFGLIGFPLGQSFSERYFTEKFISKGLHDCLYKALPLESIKDLKTTLKDPDLEGLNVTIPYKQLVLPFLDNFDEVVQKIQACNCIKIHNGKLTGYNTDVLGFEQSLLPLLKPHHTRALILGTGGSSAAVKHVLDKLNIESIFVSRQSINGSNHLVYAELDDKLFQNYNLIVNTTPLGMFPAVDFYPDIPYDFLNETHLLYDLIYNPEKTMFLKKGEDNGAAIKNGLEMLIIQAEESWKIWNNG